MYCWKVTDPWNNVIHFNDFEAMLECVFDYEYYQDYEETVARINEEYGSVDIYNRTYSAAEILENLDKDRFYMIQEQIATEKCNESRAEHEQELKDLELGEEIYIDSFKIELTVNEEDQEPDVSVDDLIGLIHYTVPR